MKRKSYMLLGLLFAVHSANAEEEKNQIQDTEAAKKYFENELKFTAGPGTAKKIVQGKTEGLIIDVRKKEHFDKEHIPGSINIPFDKHNSFEGALEDLPQLSKKKVNLVLCYELLCNLAQKAALKFAEKGYPVKELKGGFKAYKEHNYPVETSKAN